MGGAARSAPFWRASRNRSSERASHRPSGRQISTRPVIFCSIEAHLRRGSASASDAHGDIFRQVPPWHKARGVRICTDSPGAGSVPNRPRCSPLRHAATHLDPLHRIASPLLHTCLHPAYVDLSGPVVSLPAEPEQYFQAGTDSLQCRPRHGAEFRRVPCLDVNGSNLVRKNDARSCHSRRERDFQIIPSACRAASMGCDRADHRKSKRRMERVDRNDQDGPSAPLLMSDGRVRVDLQNVPLRRRPITESRCHEVYRDRSAPS